MRPSNRIPWLRAALACVLLSGTLQAGAQLPAVPQQAVKPAPAAWQAPIPGYAIDLMRLIDERRLLVGTVELGVEEYAAPQHGKLALYDPVEGKKLWEAERRNLPRGDYNVVAAGAVVLVFASQAGSLAINALDAATGAQRWQHEVKSPSQVELLDDALLVISLDGKRFKLERLDIASGRRAWSAALREELRDNAPAPALYVQEKEALVVGRSFTRIALQDGADKGSVPIALGDGAAGESERSPAGVLAWDTKTMAMLALDGKALWTGAVPGGEIRQATQGAASIYRVVGARKGPLDAAEALEALDPATGSVSWSHVAEGGLASGVLETTGLVVLTLDGALVGLDAQTGKLRFRTAFPDWFHQATPSAVGAKGQRDLLQVSGPALYVVRERAGAAAYALPEGSMAWAQAAYDIASGVNPWYSTVSSAMRLRAMVMVMGGPSVARLPQNFFPAADTGLSQMYIRSSEQRVQSYETQRQQAVARRDTSQALRLSNYQSVEISMQRFHGSMAQAQAILGGGVALGEFLSRMAMARIANATTLPKAFELRSHSRLHRSSLQDGYYLRPFSYPGQGRGLTIIELSSGRRLDLVHSTHEGIPPWIDLHAFTIGREPVPRLYTLGTGLEPGKAEIVKVRGMGMMRPALIAYDLGALPFGDRSEKFESQLAGTAPFWKANVLQSASFCNTFHVARGMDAAEPGGQPSAPLRTNLMMVAAREGCIDVLRLLLNRGTDVNTVSQFGKTALELAADDPTRDFLLKAGAKSR